MLDILTLATFEPHVGSTFTLVGADLTLNLTLVEANGRSDGCMESFSLIFRGPSSPVAEQALHRLQHPALGAHDIFLGPVHLPGFEGIPYQAVFNRLLPHS